MEYKRTDRVADQIKMEVADILSKKAKDPRIGWVTILSVDLSPDLSHARLFVSMPDHEKETLWGLKKASGFIRSELARRLPLRRVPDLTFLADRSVEKVSRLLSLLDQAGEELKRKVEDDGERIEPL